MKIYTLSRFLYQNADKPKGTPVPEKSESSERPSSPASTLEKNTRAKKKLSETSSQTPQSPSRATGTKKLSPETQQRVQNFNREARSNIAQSPTIPPPEPHETGPLRNMREYARERQEEYRQEEQRNSTKTPQTTGQNSNQEVQPRQTQTPKEDTVHTNPSRTVSASSRNDEQASAAEGTTQSGAPRVRQNIDTGSTVVVDREGRKVRGSRLSDRDTGRTEPVDTDEARGQTTQSGAPRVRQNIDTGSTVIVDENGKKMSGQRESSTSLESTQTSPQNASGKDAEKENTATGQTEFVTRRNLTNNERTLHWRSLGEQEWQSTDGSVSGAVFPPHLITRGASAPSGFEDLYTPKKTDKKSSTPETPSSPSSTPAQPGDFELAGDIDEETRQRDAAELKKYQEEQARKTPEQRETERREAKELFDMSRGDTSGITDITGTKDAEKYKPEDSIPSQPESRPTPSKKPQTSAPSESTTDFQPNEATDVNIDTTRTLAPLGGDRTREVRNIQPVDDGVSQTPVRGEGNTIYQPVNLPPTEQHPEGERGRISYTPPPKNITGAFDPYAGIDRMRQEEQQEGWTRFEGPKEWKEGDDREEQLRQSFRGGTRLLNPQQATHDTAALSKGDGMIINGSPHPDLAKRRAERVSRRIAEGRPTPNKSTDGSALDDDIATYDFGAAIGSRHAIVNNSTGEVWRSRQDRREGKPPVAIQVNRGYVNRVDSGGTQSAPNSDQLLELRGPNPYNLPFSTERHRVFVANGTIYAGGAENDQNGQISTRRIGRYNADSGEVVIDQKDPAFIEWRRKMQKDKEKPQNIEDQRFL